MATDNHRGRQATLNIQGNPERQIQMINRHGVLTSIQRGITCPNADRTAHHKCSICNGHGTIYRFQRDLLEVDERSRVAPNGLIVPWRTPIRRPVSVRRSYLGGNHDYKILQHGDRTILVEGCPKPSSTILSTYYFDRFDLIEDDPVICDENSLTAVTTRTFWDEDVLRTNYQNAHDDLAFIESVRHENGFKYEVSGFRLNVIRLKPGGPPLETGKVLATYYKCPLDMTLPADMDDRTPREQAFNLLSSSELRVAVKPWHDLAVGDVMVFRGVSRQRQQALTKAPGNDELSEFEVRAIDLIMDERGREYASCRDFILHDNKFIRWLDNAPAVGERFTVRYSFRPAYVIFENEATPNALERKRYPITVLIKRWSRTTVREREFADQSEPVQAADGWTLPAL